MTDQTANARNRATVRVLSGVLIAMFAIYGVTRMQPSDDAATLAVRTFAGILIAVLSIYLMASGIKSVTSSGACGLKSSEQHHPLKP